jgi:2-oxo-3-hexenedioate decarboxylase
MDRGHVSNVLDGPLSAVRHLVELLSSDPDNLPLAAGEIVTSGTLTRALPVKAGETWTTKLNGIGLDGISLRFCFDGERHGRRALMSHGPDTTDIVRRE